MRRAEVQHRPAGGAPMTIPRRSNPPLNVVFSYARIDVEHVRALDTHLALHRRLGLIKTWTDLAIVPGAEWNEVIASKLETADIILLMISSDYVESKYAYEIEMEIAMRRHREGVAR